MTKKEEKRIYEGLITESFPDGRFRVLLDNDDKADNHNTDIILGYISGKIRRRFIRILPGDRVQIEVSQYDPTRGRIIYRLPLKKPSKKSSENLNKASENPDKSSENLNKASENPDKSSENLNKASENPDKSSENLNKSSENLNKASENPDKASEKPNKNKASENPDKASTKPNKNKASENPDKASKKPNKNKASEN
uniref:translational initiation factor 1 n=1 Tax=Gaultheria nummularioides TaxID=157517 RepID=UPI001FF3593F|nr:translational initiation factor 1 [Gaultheria nummularioides]UGO88416.1 translational initiation factor 1 [Gaultheria nummularioides]UOU95631.1 translational initiation factor 1 [Gaultheria nummularioides]